MNTHNDAPDERFYVVGNGPSLSRRLLAALPAGRWLGMNSAYRYWEQTGQYPRLYACVDPVVGKAQAEGIARLIERPEVEALLLHEQVAEALPPSCRQSPKIEWRNEFVKRGDLGVPFSALAMQKQTTGALAARFAIARGFRNLQLLGIDCRYVEVIDEAQAVSGIELRIGQQPKDNPNYFFSGYQSVGDTYQVPNPPVHSGNLHLQSFVALRNDVDAADAEVRIVVGSLDSLLAQHGVFDYESPFTRLGIRRIGAVAVPLMAREVPQLLENLAQWTDPRTCPSLRPEIRGTCLHLLFSDAPSAEQLQAIARTWAEHPALGETFDGLRFTVLPIPESLNHYIRDASTSASPSTKSGPNCAFLAGMAQLQDYDYTLYIETDCLPFRFGWLDAADRAIEKAGEDSWIIGSAYSGGSRLWTSQKLHINGNAIYRTGDARFRAFIRDVFLPTLEHLLAAGVRSLAYDTTLSLAYSCLETLPAQLSAALYDALPRFAFSPLIGNVGGNAESANPDSVPIERILNSADGTYFMHGRVAKLLLQRAEHLLKEAFRRTTGTTRARLALHWGGTSISGLEARFLGYGRVDLLSTASGPDGDRADGSVSLSFIRIDPLAVGPRFFGGSLSLHPPCAQVASLELVFRSDQGIASRARCTSEESAEPGALRIRFQSVTPVPEGVQKVVVVLSVRGVPKAGLGIRNAELVEGPSTPAIPEPALRAVEPNEACEGAIEAWSSAVERLQSGAPRSEVGRAPCLLDWQSARFLIVDFRPLEDGFSAILTRRSQTVATDPNSPRPALMLSIVNWPLETATGLSVSVMRRQPRQGSAKVKLRVCRHGSTAWQYQDFKLRLDGSLAELQIEKLPFSIRHEGYRIEIHDEDPESLDEDFELLVRAGGLAKRSTALAQSLPASRPLHGRRATATGQLKSLLFSRWDGARLRQVWDRHSAKDRYAFGAPEQAKPEGASGSPGALLELCRSFNPELVYVRPTDDPGFMRLTSDLLAGMQAPIIVHVMDDWMERSRGNDPAKYAALGDSFDAIVRKARGHLSISPLMSSMLAFRHGHTWTPVANGVRTTDYRDRAKARKTKQPFVIRYMGGLADDMCWSTVQRVARTVQAMSSRVPVRFEVHTMDWYIPKARKAWEGMDAVSVGGLVEADRYQESLASADALLVAYNFDDKSIAYTRYSRSNKLPECLLSGTPVLAVGPAVCCTLAELADARDACMLVTSEEPAELEQAIARLMGDEAWLAQRPAAVRRLLSTRFDVETTISTFERVLGEALAGPGAAPPAAQPRPSAIAEANLAFRQGELQAAFRAYAALYRAHPLPMYRDNALRCLARAGLDPASFEHAAQTWHHAPQPSITQRAT
jgi:glycosyltransferase involved in cell wall biosynthesis